MMVGTGTQSLPEREALATLAWLIEAGVDCVVEDAPRDWLADDAPAAPIMRETPMIAPAPRLSAAAGATALAATATSLEALRAIVESYEGCALKASAKRTVFADGAAESGVMLIGEAPGAEEDRIGKPFVGEAGRLLDRMLASIGRDRGSAYISNILFWRPPGNRTPSADEIAACMPFVRRHIELARPRALLALGGTAAKALLDSGDGINRLRGRWHELRIGALTIPVMPTFHPAYLLRQPAHKAMAWADLLAFRARIEG